MNPTPNINTKWLKIMYIYTLIGAGGFGLGLVFFPDLIKMILLGWSVQEPIAIGIISSSFLAFAFLSFLGLRSPLRWMSILMLQLSYKLIWMITVFLPMLFQGELSLSAIAVAVIFITYIIGDLIALPIKDLLSTDDAS